MHFKFRGSVNLNKRCVISVFVAPNKDQTYQQAGTLRFHHGEWEQLKKILSLDPAVEIIEPLLEDPL